MFSNLAIVVAFVALLTEAYKGHCVLCKDVLSFVFQTFDFQVLAFVLLNGAMET